MFSRCFSKSLFLASILVLLSAFSAGCDMKSGKLSPKSPAVTSLIEIPMQVEPGYIPGNKAVIPFDKYEIYKATQAQLIKSPLVLTAALRKPEVTSLSICKQHEDDPISWLQKNIEVSYPGDSEIMQVSLYDSNRAEAAKLLNAVVDAYLTEIVETEQKMKARELAAVEEVLAGKQRQLRQRRTTIKALAEELGTVDNDALNVELQFASQQLSLHQQQLFKVDYDLRNLKAEREIIKATLNRLEKANKPKGSGGNAGEVRPELRRVVKEMAGLAGQLSLVVAKLSDVELSQRLQNDLANVQRQIEGWQKMLNVQLASFGRAELREEIAALDIRIELTSEYKVELEKKIKEFKQIGRSSIELEMMRAELENLEEVVRSTAIKRETIEVETKSRPRIRLLQRAEMPH